MMKKKPYHLRFYIKTTSQFGNNPRLYNGQIEYKGDSISECVVKALAYARVITSFTIRRGEGKGKNIKMPAYLNSLFPKTSFPKFQ